MMNEMTFEMKPCPFCGCTKQRIRWIEVDGNYFLHYIECCECNAHTDAFHDREEAIKAWNRRTEQ